MPTLPLDEILNQLVPDEDATVKRLSVSPATPPIVRLDDGVEDPIPMFPLASTLKILVPVEDATLKASFVPAVPCTLKVMVDDVAFTPVTAPLSIKSPAPSVVADVQRVTSPVVPPAIEETIPSDDVATQRVDVPTDWRTIPRVPDADTPSRRVPRRLRLVVVPVPTVSLVVKKVFAVSPVAEAVFRLACPCTVRIPVAVRLEEEALAKLV